MTFLFIPLISQQTNQRSMDDDGHDVLYHWHWAARACHISLVSQSVKVRVGMGIGRKGYEMNVM